MKVLSIGTDRKMFEENSPVLLRQIDYTSRMEEMHVVVFTLKNSGLKKKTVGNLHIYPTNSFSKFFYISDAVRIGKKIILENKFVRGDSVVTCQDPFECGFVGWRISRKFKLPLHLQIHTDFLDHHFSNSLLQKIRVMTAKFILPRANYVRVVSKRISDSIKKEKINLKHEPRILPIRIDAEALAENKPEVDFSKMFPQFRFTVLMASRLTKEKNIDHALKAFSKVLKSHPYAGLIIAGDGPLREFLERKTKTLGIEKNVVFLGWRDDVFSLMKSANMFLNCSAYEGYGMSIIEAGLAKCPVLTTNVGVTGYFLVHKKNSYICPVGDIMCLYDGIIDVLNDNGFRYNMAEKLAFDVESAIPKKEEYIRRYVELLEEVKK